MPPKKTFNRDESDDDDDSTVDSTSSDDDVQQTRKQASNQNSSASAVPQGRGVVNKPHDEEFEVGHEDDGVKTPPQGAQRKPAPAATTTVVTPAAKSGGTVLRNNPNDETFDVEDDRPVRTPPRGGSNVAAAAVGANSAANAPRGGAGGNLRNNPNDYYENVDDEVDTPPRQNAIHSQAAASKKPAALSSQQVIRNDHHDEAIDVSDHSQTNQSSPDRNSYGSATPQSTQKMPQGKPAALAPTGKMSMVHQESSSDEDDDESGNPGQASGKTAASNKPPPTQEYNPADYASINQRASREMQELFMSIASYQPVMQELPSKLRPFIPDFIPSVGDLDPFCKIPRPDGRPDNLGLTVVDEPCANQSNPAVIKIGLQYMTRGHVPSVFVDCVEDAANRPNVIEKWVADIKKLHYKKPLPSVNYSKPMPEIESLLQVWPQDFEELLNSDLQFPPTQVDLDIDQYVRVMCGILDIPTYGSLIESLHVMFTLYCEFRANQHFQHA